MKLKKIMTKKVISLTEKNSLYDCIMRFSTKRISGAPVINQRHEVIGMVTDDDVTKALDILTPSVRLTGSKLTSLLFAALRSKKEEEQILAELKEARKIKVKVFMSKPAITINQDSSLMEGIKTMCSNNITHIPIVDNKGKLVGIVARADLIQALMKVKDGVK